MAGPEHIHRHYWEDFSDTQRAVAEASALYAAVDAGELNPFEVLTDLELGAEPLWDAEHGDPALVLRVALNMQPAFVHLERSGGLRDPQRLEARARPLMLLARAQFRVEGRERDAFETLLALLTFLEGLAGGPDALADVLARPVHNAAAEATVAVLGLWPAALRRAQLPKTVREQYKQRGLKLVRPYLGKAGARVRYARTAALAAQWLYLFVEDGKAEDRELVQALYALDLETRPQTARGQATAALRDAAFAKYFRDTAGWQRHVGAAVDSLREYRMRRHEDAVRRWRYLEP